MTHITPLPAKVTREAAIAYLQNHRQMIELNPLVLRHERTAPPSNAAQDEAESMVWYEITDEIQYIPGTPIKGEVSYKAGFYDIPNGLQTHTFAPGGVDIRGKWTVGGNAPGEKPEEIEIGSNKPRDGLYIQEEVDLRCNVFLTNFVKKNLKKSHSTVVDSIVEMAASADVSRTQSFRPEHTRTNSDNISSKPSRPKRPSDASGSMSTPTSYTQTGSNHCSCPMTAFGVHMEGCRFYPRLRESHSEPERLHEAKMLQESRTNLTAELDRNPVTAQHYYASQGEGPAELE